MRPTAAFQVLQISNYCTDPVEAEWKLKGTLNLGIQKISALLRRNLMEKLHKKKLGTNQVEGIVRTIRETGRRTGHQRDN